MSFKIEKISIPKSSEISKELIGTFYSDAYCFRSKQTKRKALQIWLDHASRMPAWVNFLMATRNKLVSLFSLKNLGHIGALNTEKSLDNYQVGDRVGIFTLFFVSDNEVVLGDTDSHLSVKVSVYIDSNESDLISISTVVHTHNFFGELYMFFVKPMHKIIVPSSISRAESY